MKNLLSNSILVCSLFLAFEAHAGKKQDRAEKKAEKKAEKAAEACGDGKARKCARLEGQAAKHTAIANGASRSEANQIKKEVKTTTFATVKAENHAAKAEEACGAGKARKCERHIRKATANAYVAETGDKKGGRQMKKRDRKMQQADAACNKGKQKKCDRKTRQAAFADCKLEGGDKSGCRQQKRQDRKDQRAFRKGFSDVNVTGNLRDKLRDKQQNQRDHYGAQIGAGEDLEGMDGYADTEGYEEEYDDQQWDEGGEEGYNPPPRRGGPRGFGGQLAVQEEAPQGILPQVQMPGQGAAFDDSAFQSRLAKLREQKAMACERRGGQWTGSTCLEGRNPASVGMGGRRSAIAHPSYQYNGNQAQQRGFGGPPPRMINPQLQQQPQQLQQEEEYYEEGE